MGNRLGTAALVPNVGKVAVLRANDLGDLIFALPALAALRGAYPGAEIVLLAKEWHRGFLSDRGVVDRVVPLPATPGITVAAHDDADATAISRLLAAMQTEEFDLVVQLHGGGAYSNPFVQALGARVTAGLKAPDAPALDRWVPYIYYQHEVLRCLEVVSLVGARSDDIEPTLAVTDRDVDEACSVVGELEGRLVALHPGAADPRRRWPAERFAAVGDALAREGARVIVTAIEEERSVVDDVLDAMVEEAQPLVGRLTIGGLAGLLSHSALVVSNDTGPLHLARAVGAATIGIYWCGNMVNGGPFTRSRDRALVSWTVRCPVCGADAASASDVPGVRRARCPHDASFVADVPTRDVLFAALDLLPSAYGTSTSRRNRRESLPEAVA